MYILVLFGSGLQLLKLHVIILVIHFFINCCNNRKARDVAMIILIMQATWVRNTQNMLVYGMNEQFLNI